MKELNRPLSFSELMAPKPKRINYIEPAFLPLSGKCLIGGEAKVGKSFTSMEIARALATGTPVFHSPKFQVTRPVKVLLCDKELGVETLGRRLASFYTLASDEMRAISAQNIVAVSGNPDFHFDAVHCRPAITRELDSIRPNVMIIDPVSKFMEGSDQDNDHVRRFLEFCDVLIERYRASTQLSIVFTHHFKKPALDYRGNKIDPASSYNFRGGSRWYDDMDSLVTMQRHDIDATRWRLECEPEFRHGASPDAFWLDIQPDSAVPVRESAAPQRPSLKERMP